MIKFIFSFFIMILLAGNTSAYAKGSWQLSKDADGIKVFVRDIPGSALQSFKGEMIIPARLSSVVALLEDTKAFPQLLHNCKSAKSLELVSDTESYKYIVSDMPWPVKDRDTIVHSTLKQNKQTRQIEIILRATPKRLAVKSGLVRITDMRGRWLLSPLKNGVKVVYEMSVDPGGNLPKWLVNTLAVDIPYNTLKNLRELVRKPAYQKAVRTYIVD